MSSQIVRCFPPPPSINADGLPSMCTSEGDLLPEGGGSEGDGSEGDGGGGDGEGGTGGGFIYNI